MNKHFLKNLLVATSLVFHLPAMAEDVDLFVGAPSSNEVPNVLIIMDNTANWSSPFLNEKAALVSVFGGLPADKFRVGLMLFTETGSPNAGPDGAYVRAAIRLMDSTNKRLYSNVITDRDVGLDKSNSGKAGLTMAEAYYYFNGSPPSSGTTKVKTDYTGNQAPQGTDSPSRAVWRLPGNALPSFAGSPYTSPVVATCAKNFIIYISNGAVQESTGDTSEATRLLSRAGGNTTAIPISPSGSQTSMADEWVRFMKKSPLDVTAYTLDIDKVASGQGPGWTALLKSMAGVSGGKYFDVASSGTQIADALTSIFSEIQSVNSVFASVSLPVSVNTQGTFLNQVYIGMFRPDQDSFPRWNGNLKQYKLGFNGGTLKLLDAASSSAISSGGSGFIAECARSFWTPTALDTYWDFRPQGNCLLANSDVSNTPDGNIVEKGAQAFMLRRTTTRNVRTCSPTSCTTLTDFNSTNVSPSMLTPVTNPVTPTLIASQRDALINWLRGQDLQDENNNNNIAEMRPSAHGDVVHSRPIAINYGTDALPQVVIFYGGNDGVLRAVNGNRPDRPTPDIGTATPGSELWSFIAPEFYPKIKRIYDNTIQIGFPGQLLPLTPRKDYGVDGPITAYKDASNAYLYATLRRGGNAMYAFDVTNLNLARAPLLKWKKDTVNLPDLGETWSSPKVLNAAGYGAGASPMLIMGGGYDTCHDVDGNANNCGSKGKKIYVLDANTGVLLKTFDTDSSVIADIIVAPDSTGLAKYAYTADLGGNVYRISGATANSPIGNTAPGSWTITKIAALGGSGVDNRKFIFAPDVVDDNGNYALLVGSGDREKPLASFTFAAAVTNRFFMIKDNPTDVNWLTSESSNCRANVICTNSLLAITTSATPTAAELATKKGWYLALASSEQVVTAPITVFGTVTFSTHRPTPPLTGQCTTLGTATVYNLNYTNAAAPAGQTGRGQVITGGGLPPSPVAGMVTLDDGTTVPFIIGASPNSALEGGVPPEPFSVKRPKSRVYWNIKK